MPPVSAECSDHPTLLLVVRIKHLNAPSQCSRIFCPSKGSAREEDIAIAISWFLFNNNFMSFISVYDLMSGVMRDILDEDDIEGSVVQEGFQDDFKTEIKTRRKNF